jgi:ribonuclease P protein component
MLRQRSEFEAVLQSALRVSTRHFVAHALTNSVCGARLGIIAGRKAAPRAVDRNRGKRFIREAFRAACPELGAYDITVQLRSNLRSQDNSAVRAELSDLLDSLARRCAAQGARADTASPGAIASAHHKP